MPRSKSRKRGWARLPAAGVAAAGTLAAAALSSAVGTAVPGTPAAFAAGPASTTASAPPAVTVTPDVIRVPGAPRQAPPTTAQCRSGDGIYCYQPSQLRTAYHLPALYAKGITGKGQTIAIVDSFGSPTIKSDLATFDKQFGIAAPPAFTIIHPAGKIPAFNPDNSDMVNWATETTLDVEYAHALAPGARILLVETPVSETEGTAGFPQIVAAEKYVLAHYKVGVISQSFSATEQTFTSYALLKPLRAAYIEANNRKVTVLAASGDSGATDYTSNMVDYYTHRVTSWPDSDPLVTAVGGTALEPSGSGYTSVAWNDTFDQAWELYSTGSTSPVPNASGGGKSEFFARPSWQNGVKAITGAHRGVPDISMSAACDGSVDVYSSFEPGAAGWTLICGTSEATPEFAAIVALADQVAGHPLGLINPKLYALLAKHAPGLVDVTSGNNTVSFYQGSAALTTVTGYQARKGYDLVTGVGTINAALFVPELAS
jgi:subtilase family serine protease